jgi:hypothetical protein
MQASCFVFAISRFDQPETWIVVLLAASESPLQSKAVVDRLGPASGRTAIERAIRRLMRDQVVLETMRDHLRLADPHSWPSHRVSREDLLRLDLLTRPTHDDQPVATPAAHEKPVHPAIAAARAVALRKAKDGR